MNIPNATELVNYMLCEFYLKLKTNTVLSKGYMQCETISYCYIKIHWSILHFEWLFCPKLILLHQALAIWKILVHKVMSLSNVDPFYYIILKRKITFVNITTSIINKVFKYGKLSGGYKFSEILIFALKSQSSSFASSS